MLIKNIPVHFSLNHEDEVCIYFASFKGTLNELQDFRRSFDYQCYTFGKGRFTSAHWTTIQADDDVYCKYPRIIGLKNDHGREILLSWDELNDLIAEAMLYAIRTHVYPSKYNVYNFL